MVCLKIENNQTTPFGQNIGSLKLEQLSKKYPRQPNFSEREPLSNDLQSEIPNKDDTNDLIQDKNS